MSCQQRVADERYRIDKRVRDDERIRPPPAQEQDPEDDAHDHVAEERADPLVQVIGAAQDGADRDRGGGPHAEQPEPAQQVADDQHLLKDSVLQRAQQQHRDPPSDRRQARRDDVQADPGFEGQDVQDQAAAADQRGQPGAAQQVASGLRQVHPDGRGPSPFLASS